MMSNLVEDEKENILKKNKLEENVDEVVESVCENLKKNELCPGEYADTVKALAALVEARAKLC